MPDSIAGISRLPVRLPVKLWMLRLVARRRGPRHEELAAWSTAHPEITASRKWNSRAWWGTAARKLVRWHLDSASRRAAALRLVDHVEDKALEEARQTGRGVIVATAHLGPPQFLMHWMIDQKLPLLVWTATRTPPAGADHAVYLDPRKQDERSVLLVKSALHLRRPGVLLGAADSATGERPITMERLCMRRQFSAGLPALARQTGSLVVIGLALWKRDHIRIEFEPIENPDNGLGGFDRDRMWLEQYWELMQPPIRDSPENLRFLRLAVESVEPVLG